MRPGEFDKATAPHSLELTARTHNLLEQWLWEDDENAMLALFADLVEAWEYLRPDQRTGLKAEADISIRAQDIVDQHERARRLSLLQRPGPYAACRTFADPAALRRLDGRSTRRAAT